MSDGTNQYLNQCWLIISDAFYIDLRSIAQIFILDFSLKIIDLGLQPLFQEPISLPYPPGLHYGITDGGPVSSVT